MALRKFIKFTVMKKINFILVSLLLFCSSAIYSQERLNALPQVFIQTLDGNRISTAELQNDGKPIILSFWATWCKPCLRELTVLSEVYDEWKEETGVKIIAVSIDDARTTRNVLPFVKGRAWEFEVYLDANSDFKRAMNVNLIPHTFILNGKGEIVWQHTSFAEGGEEKMFEVLKSLVKP